MKLIIDKVCNISIFALLISMTAAMFYSPNSQETEIKEPKKINDQA